MKYNVQLILLVFIVIGGPLGWCESHREFGLESHDRLDENKVPRKEMIRHLSEQLNHEQKVAFHEHIGLLRTKHQHLNDILRNLSSEYKELSSKENLLQGERLQLIQLRQKLIANSHDARDKIREIRELNRKFKQKNPDIAQLHQRMQPIKRGIQAIRNTKREINQLLAKDSPEYAELLKKEFKTSEDHQKIRRLRRELIPQNQEARALRRRGRVIKRRLRQKIQQHRAQRREQPRGHRFFNN